MRWLSFLVLVGCPAISDRQLQDRRDLDDDGYFSAGLGGDDCDDLDGAVHPGAAEVCDGLDNDCDGLLNEADPSAEAAEVEWYLDADEDGFGSELVHERSCRVLAGYVHAGGDCDDTDGREYPGQVWYLDGDGDGFGVEASSRVQCEQPPAYIQVTAAVWDCDDANPLVNPDRPEVCGGGDDNCDLLVDEDDPDAAIATWFPDVDRDGWGEVGADERTCSPQQGAILTGLDCDDGDASIHPGAADPFYDGIDSDCGADDDFDADGDGSSSEDPRQNPDALGSADDCDDARWWVEPGAAEICNGVPDDCSNLGTWDPSSEDGLAYFTPDAGLSPAGMLPPSPVDWTSTLETGGVVSLGESGTLALCGAPAGSATWSGAIVVTGGSVTVLAPSGPDATVLDSSAAATAGIVADFGGALANPGTLSVVGLALVNGTGHAPAPAAPRGGCLYASGLAGVELADVRLEGCAASVGGGAYVSATGVVVTDTELLGNVADGALEAGGGMRILAESLTIERATIDGNSAPAGDGGGISATVNGNAPTFAIVDTTLSNNDAGGYGGGLDLRRVGVPVPTAVLRGDTFSGNTAVYGGAVRNVQIEVALDDGLVTANEATWGGGIYAQGPLAVEDSVFTDNLGSTYGGAIYLLAGAGSTSTCTSPTPGASRFQRNDRAAVVVVGGNWVSTGCDYAVNGSANDNTPADVLATAQYDYATEAFSCTPFSCAPSP